MNTKILTTLILAGSLLLLPLVGCTPSTLEVSFNGTLSANTTFPHHTTHQNGGTDVIILSGLSGTGTVLTSPTLQGTVSEGTGLTMSRFTMPNNTPIKLTTTSGVTYNAFFVATNNWTELNANASGGLVFNNGVAQDILAFTTAGGTRIFNINTDVASAGTPLQDSQYFRMRARYWNGSASVVWPFDIYHDMTASGATPASHVDLRINSLDILTLQNNNGTLSITAGAPVIMGSNYTQYTEMTAPGAGAADTARIYANDPGDGLTDLNAVFQDGTVVTFAQETTPLTSPIFTQPSGTEVKYVMKKPHPGLVQFVARFPDGSTFVLKQIEYHDAEKIAANTGAEGPLPKGWVVTTSAQRAAKADLTAIKHDDSGQGMLTKEQQEQ